MEILYEYLNGNVLVTIHSDGTKSFEWKDEEKPVPLYPSSMDIKITNYCDANCKFCHEMSTIHGKHGNLELIKEVIKTLPNGTELAIGGGNPLDHPKLTDFLIWCKYQKLIPNMTVNSKHLLKYKDTLNYLIDNKLIYGVGLSIEDDFDFNLLDEINNTSNMVFHVIAGVNSPDILNKIRNSKVKKILILGYKEVGRGIYFKDSKVDALKQEWFDNIHKYLRRIHLSFDNLAIEQLQIRRFLSDKQWNSFYMGEEGQFTMYIDAVKEEFATSSTSALRFPLQGGIKDLFKKVRQINNFD